MTDDESLTKVHIDLTGHPETGGEAMWAKPLGDDLYEPRNCPFFAHDLNFLDVVRAVSAEPDLKPSILGVHQRSGHRTIWVTLSAELTGERCIELATNLNQGGAFFENANGRFFAVDVEPDGDYERVLGLVEEWRASRFVAKYRTGASDSDVRYA